MVTLLSSAAETAGRIITQSALVRRRPGWERWYVEILKHPNPALRQVCEAVDPVEDPSLAELARRMAETMYESEGVGIAASQVGVLKRLIIVDVEEDVVRPIALCNPVVVEEGEEREVAGEGCLSVPGIDVPIERPTTITVEAQSLDGSHISFTADGLLARCIQHEIDHLDGFTIIERARPEDRLAVMAAYREAQSKGVSSRGASEG